jgi:hypothetical protein
MSPTNFQPTTVHVRIEKLRDAIRWVCNRLNFTIDRVNMNPRNLSERFDDGVMGEIASAAVVQFLTDHNRYALAYDQIRRDKYQEADPGWDILTARESFEGWLKSTNNVKIKPSFSHSLSIKSSRIPETDKDDIQLAISRRDFKILKTSNSIEKDLTSDFEVQVYFLLEQSKYNNKLQISMKDVEDQNIENIAKNLRLVERYGSCYLSGAASRETLIKHSKSLPEQKRFWNSYHVGHEKHMWCAPLTLGISFQQLDPK